MALFYYIKARTSIRAQIHFSHCLLTLAFTIYSNGQEKSSLFSIRHSDLIKKVMIVGPSSETPTFVLDTPVPVRRWRMKELSYLARRTWLCYDSNRARPEKAVVKVLKIWDALRMMHSLTAVVKRILGFCCTLLAVDRFLSWIEMPKILNRRVS